VATSALARRAAASPERDAAPAANRPMLPDFSIMVQKYGPPWSTSVCQQDVASLNSQGMTTPNGNDSPSDNNPFVPTVRLHRSSRPAVPDATAATDAGEGSGFIISRTA